MRKPLELPRAMRRMERRTKALNVIFYAIITTTVAAVVGSFALAVYILFHFIHKIW